MSKRPAGTHEASVPMPESDTYFDAEERVESTPLGESPQSSGSFCSARVSLPSFSPRIDGAPQTPQRSPTTDSDERRAETPESIAASLTSIRSTASLPLIDPLSLDESHLSELYPEESFMHTGLDSSTDSGDCFFEFPDADFVIGDAPSQHSTKGKVAAQSANPTGNAASAWIAASPANNQIITHSNSTHSLGTTSTQLTGSAHERLVNPGQLAFKLDSDSMDSTSLDNSDSYVSFKSVSHERNESSAVYSSIQQALQRPLCSFSSLSQSQFADFYSALSSRSSGRIHSRATSFSDGRMSRSASTSRHSGRLGAFGGRTTLLEPMEHMARLSSESELETEIETKTDDHDNTSEQRRHSEENDSHIVSDSEFGAHSLGPSAGRSSFQKGSASTPSLNSVPNLETQSHAASNVSQSSPRPTLVKSTSNPNQINALKGLNKSSKTGMWAKSKDLRATNSALTTDMNSTVNSQTTNASEPERPRRRSLVQRIFGESKAPEGDGDQRVHCKEVKHHWYGNILRRPSEPDLVFECEDIKVFIKNKEKPSFNKMSSFQELRWHKAGINCMKLSNDEKYLATGGDDCVLCIWKLKKNVRLPKYKLSKDHGKLFESEPIRVFSGHQSAIVDVDWSKNYFIITGSLDNSAIIWHIQHDSPLRVFEHRSYVTAVAFNPVNEELVAIATGDKVMRLWSVMESKYLHERQVESQISAITFDRTGSDLFAGTVNGICKIFDVEGLSYKTSIIIEKYRLKKACKISSLLHHPTENKLLIVTSDSRLRLFNTVDRTLFCKYKGFKNSDGCIQASFGDNGRLILTGSQNCGVYIWDTKKDIDATHGSNLRERRDRNESYEVIFGNRNIVRAAAYLFYKSTLPPPAGEDTRSVVISASCDGVVRIFIQLG